MENDPRKAPIAGESQPILPAHHGPLDAIALLEARPADQRERLERLAALLIAANRRLNLTAVTDPAEVRVRHLADSLAALPLIAALAPYPTRAADGVPELVDLGSGGGFPGLALAIALPEWRVVSVEATAKKARFQESAVEALGLTNVEVVCERIEAVGRRPEFRERFALATARALAALNVVAELALPLVAVGGHVLAWKGRRVDEEIVAGRAACTALGGKVAGMVRYRIEEGERRKAEGETAEAGTGTRTTEGRTQEAESAGRAESDLRIVVIEKLAACPRVYPRNAGAMAKRPLGAERGGREKT